MARLPSGDKILLVLKAISTCSIYMLSDQLYRLSEYTVLTALGITYDCILCLRVGNNGNNHSLPSSIKKCKDTSFASLCRVSKLRSLGKSSA